MNTGEAMRVYTVDTEYQDVNSKLVITDVPAVPFINARNPLYIGVRTGQVKRMKHNIHNEKLGGTSIGFWELSSAGYLSKKGKINLENFRKHDVIFFANPTRIDEKKREIYSQFIEAVRSDL